MAYLKVNWPEIQDYMNNSDYPENCYYDPLKDVWFVPETWVTKSEEEIDWMDIGDWDNKMG